LEYNGHYFSLNSSTLPHFDLHLLENPNMQ
jgi:hypothetical protein